MVSDVSVGWLNHRSVSQPGGSSDQDWMGGKRKTEEKEELGDEVCDEDGVGGSRGVEGESGVEGVDGRRRT